MRRATGRRPILRAESRKDKDFLAAHYRALGDETPDDGDLVLRGRGCLVSLAARSVADWVARPPSRKTVGCARVRECH